MAGSIANCAAAGALLIATAAAMAQQAVAQSYPVKPLLVLTPFAPGPGPDLYMRPLTMKLGEQLGQTVVLESKIGAGGALAVRPILRAPADGYTLTVITNSHLIQSFVRLNIDYDVVNELAHITRLSASSLLLVVPAMSQINRVEDLLTLAKSSPGKLNYGSGGIGTPSHLAGATLQFLAGIDTVHVPFKNSNDVIPSILRGDMQYAFQVISFAAPYVRAGKLRVLATTAGARLRDLPEVPTMNELQKNDLYIQESWTGLAVAARTPAAIVRRLFAETTKAFADPAVQKGIEASGVSPGLSESPEQYTAYLKRENEKWREIVKLSSIKPE